jgi:hypothetical protein
MKTILLIATLLFTIGVQAQTPMQKKKADYYANEAISYFKLSDSKKSEIYENKLQLLMAQKEMDTKRKSGELPESEVDAYRKKNVYPFTQKLLTIIGVTFKELSAFNDIVHPVMNQLKE